MDYWILLIAYVLALLANAAASIFWGVQYKRVTDRLLEAKEAQIVTLRELTSTKVFEHFQSTKTLLEDSIRDKEDQIRSLKDQQVSTRSELHDQLVEMRDDLAIQLQVSKDAFEKDMRLLAVPGRIEQVEFPLDLKEIEAILLDAGLLESDANEMISKLVTLPKGWSIGRVRGFLRQSVLEANERNRLSRVQIDLLDKINKGKGSFTPGDFYSEANYIDSLRKFQVQANELIRLHKTGYIHRILASRESFEGQLYVDQVTIIEGLTAEGYDALKMLSK